MDLRRKAFDRIRFYIEIDPVVAALGSWLSVSLPREGPRLVAIVAIRKAYREAKLKEASSKLPKVIRGASGRAGRHEGKILHLTLGRSSP